MEMRPRLFRRGRTDDQWLGAGPVTEAHLRHALEHGQFIVHYQPIFVADGGALAGLETLVRWQLPGGKLIPPVRFLAAAESTGMILPLGEFVLRTACAFVRRLQIERSQDLQISVNCSLRELLDPELASRVRRALDDAGLESQFLNVEVKEQVVAAQLDRAADALSRVRTLGVSTLLDDFGVIPEALEHLRRLGVESVKVDLWAATRSEAARALVLEAIRVADSQRVYVVAKRVETLEEIEFFHTLRVEYVQGYAFGVPEPQVA